MLFVSLVVGITVCHCQLLVFMQNAQQMQSKALPITVASEAKVCDLADELLKFPAETTGLPQAFMQRNGISISYQGVKLNPNDVLSDIGVCAEVVLSYHAKKIKMTTADVYTLTQFMVEAISIISVIFQLIILI